MTSSPRAVGRPREPDMDERVLDAARRYTASVDGAASPSTRSPGGPASARGRSTCAGAPRQLCWWMACAPPRRHSATSTSATSRRTFGSSPDSGWRSSGAVEGTMISRLIMDRQSNEELAAVIGELDYPDYIRSTRALVRRAVERGEIDPRHQAHPDRRSGRGSHHHSRPKHASGDSRRLPTRRDYLDAARDASVLRGVGYRDLRDPGVDHRVLKRHLEEGPAGQVQPHRTPAALPPRCILDRPDQSIALKQRFSAITVIVGWDTHERPSTAQIAGRGAPAPFP